MKFSELDFATGHSLNQLFSGTELSGEFMEFAEKKNLSADDWQLVLKTLENIEKEKVDIAVESAMGRTVFGDITSGGGSTEILLRSALLSIITGVAPEEILFLVSFENQIDVIKNRMAQLLPEKKDAIDRITFSTASMFLEGVLKEEVEGESLLVRLGMAENFSYSSKWMELLTEARRGINPRVYFWMVLNRKLTSSLYSVPDELKDDTEEIYRAYDVALENRQLFDRIGMCNLLRRFYGFNKEFLMNHFCRFSAIFVDDAQRYLPGEWPVLKLFAGGTHLAACGDFSMSFYTPGSIQLGMKFRSVKLTETFRHSPLLIECMSKLSGRSITSRAQTADTAFVYYEAKDEEDELEFIAFQIKKLIDKGIQASDIAVVYETEKFPLEFSNFALKQGVDCLEYPSVGAVIPMGDKLSGIIESNPGAPLIELMKEKLSPREFGRVSPWFERRLRAFGPYEPLGRRNSVIAQDARKIKERSTASVKLVREYFSKAYQFKVVFLPGFEAGAYPGNMKSILYKIISRAASGVFMTRPLIKKPLYSWQSPKEPKESGLVEFLPSETLRGSARGPLKKLLKKIF